MEAMVVVGSGVRVVLAPGPGSPHEVTIKLRRATADARFMPVWTPAAGQGFPVTGDPRGSGWRNRIRPAIADHLV
jgi:hypothetical protein